MGGKQRIAVVLVGAVLLAAFAVGCGGSNSSSDSTSGSSEASGKFAPNTKFTATGVNAAIVHFGQEADAAEREAASKVLEENLRARAAGEWAKQCATLSAGAIKQLEQEAAHAGLKKDCAKSLEYGSEPANVTEAIRADTMTGPIDVLRIKGSKAWALYHGAKGKDYAIEMIKEGGEWKVVALVTTELS
jgi:hypothetical protein